MTTLFMHLFGFVAALGLMSEPYAQTRDERATEPPRKKSAPPSLPDRVKPKPPAPHVDHHHVAPQATGSTARPPQRDVSLTRCDNLRPRMEHAMREETRGGDTARMQRLGEERRSIYQQQLRAGCI